MPDAVCGRRISPKAVAEAAAAENVSEKRRRRESPRRDGRLGGAGVPSGIRRFVCSCFLLRLFSSVDKQKMFAVRATVGRIHGGGYCPLSPHPRWKKSKLERTRYVRVEGAREEYQKKLKSPPPTEKKMRARCELCLGGGLRGVDPGHFRLPRQRRIGVRIVTPFLSPWLLATRTVIRLTFAPPKRLPPMTLAGAAEFRRSGESNGGGASEQLFVGGGGVARIFTGFSRNGGAREIRKSREQKCKAPPTCPLTLPTPLPARAKKAE